MANELDRRTLLQLLGVGGVVLGSGLPGFSLVQAAGGSQDFFFLQLSDSHWGFSGPPNPQADQTLKQAVQAVNASSAKPDFIVFTGDLTHTTDDDAVRRKRMAEFKAIVADLKVPKVIYLPGEHDAALDKGQAYQENFGALHQTFDHRGIKFIALDNVSDPGASVGDTQIDWMKSQLAKVDKDAPVVILAHRPLFDLAPQWDWATTDGANVISVLEPYKHVTVFYGHIHQENHHETGHISHHSAKSLIFPLPAPLSVPKKAAVPWDPEHPARGLGYREIEVKDKGRALTLEEYDVKGARV